MSAAAGLWNSSRTLPKPTTTSCSVTAQGNLDESLAYFRRAIELKPNFAEAHNNLGLALQQQEKYEEAIAVWQRCVQIAPEDSVARHMLAAGTGRNVPARCVHGYIRSAFDRVVFWSSRWKRPVPAIGLTAASRCDTTAVTVMQRNMCVAS